MNLTLNFFYGRIINSPVDSASYRLWLNEPSDGITNWTILKNLAGKFLWLPSRKIGRKVSDDGWAKGGGRERRRLMKSLLIVLHSMSGNVGRDAKGGSYIISLNSEGCR